MFLLYFDYSRPSLITIWDIYTNIILKEESMDVGGWLHLNFSKINFNHIEFNRIFLNQKELQWAVLSIQTSN